jgi:anti-sigma factor RsiW
MTILPVTEADLHAYVDGLLPLSRRAEIEAWLAARPEEAARLAAYRNQNLELGRLFDPVLDEPVPRAIGLPAARRFRGAAPAWRIAAALAIALLGAGAGWTLRGASIAGSAMASLDAADAAPGAADASHARQAAIAHVVYSPDVRHPVEIGADQEDQLVTWRSKRLGTPIRPPRLGKLGYELIGGRLLPGQSGPVAQFMYHNLAGQRLTLYVSTEQSHNRDTGFRFAQEGPVSVFYWIDGKFGYALSAGASKGELARLAVVVHDQLENKQ